MYTEYVSVTFILAVAVSCKIKRLALFLCYQHRFARHHKRCCSLN